MNLKDQVCTLEQGKELKELGVKAKSYFSWIGYNKSSAEKERLLNPTEFQEARLWQHDFIRVYPAYSVAELGVMLPAKIFCGSYQLHKRGNIWVSGYVHKGEYPYEESYFNKTFGYAENKNPAQAAADSLMNLLECDQIKPEDCKL